MIEQSHDKEYIYVVTKNMPITFKLERDGKQWHAYCPQLEGCHTFGTTKSIALLNLKDAVMLYFEDEIENQSMKAVLTSLELGNTKLSHV